MFFSQSIDLVLGPMQVGYSIATFLFGLATVQAYLYFQDFSEDPLGYRILVGVTWLCELGHQISSSHAIYFYTITKFGQIFVLETDRLPVSFNFIVFFLGVNNLLVSGFFAYRLRDVKKQTATSLFVGFLALGRTALYLTLFAFAFVAHSAADLIQQRKTYMVATFFIAAAAELFLTANLCIDLYDGRQTQIYRFSCLGDRLLMWFIGTGLATSIAMIALAVCFVTMENNLVWQGVFIPLPRLFAIALLVSLNARSSLHRGDSSKVIPMDNIESRIHATRGQSGKTSITTLQIAVETIETTDAASLYQGTDTKTEEMKPAEQPNPHTLQPLRLEI